MYLKRAYASGMKIHKIVNCTLFFAEKMLYLKRFFETLMSEKDIFHVELF